MVAEFGYFCLITLVLVSGLEVLLSLWGEIRKQPQWLSANRILSVFQVLLAMGSFGALAYGFITDDFTLSYVAQHSNSQLPTFFKFAATWGGHEGSMLFWLTALVCWTGVFCIFSGKTDRLFAHRTLASLSFIILGFALFILLASSPFERTFPPQPEGRDLNPMLQDIGLIFHPPLLYLGYVGFAITFAMTIAMLLGGVFDYAIARWMRPWAVTAWGFLTAGIILGAWWAYYELGWGGWWFWDPVENASLMPWLLGTALIHSLVVSEQRGIFNYWTILFAIFAFALSLLGTFIVRSGVLTSVHAFAVDAERGFALLILFFSLSFVALSLFALKVNLWQGHVRFYLLSKETALLFLNGLFTLATVVVVLGTFYPMIFSAMGWGAISIGPPYFNTVFTPLALILMSMMGFGTVLKWKRFDANYLWKQGIIFIVAIVCSIGLSYSMHSRVTADTFAFLPIAFNSLAIWIIFTHFPYRKFMWQIRPLAMRLAHIGFAICVIGAMMNSYYGDEVGVRLKPQERSELAGFYFEYAEHYHDIGENYTAEKVAIRLYDGNHYLDTVYPERRYYDVRTMTMAEVGLAHKGLDDIYVVMGDKLGHKEYAFRLHYKPYVRALWLGGLIMVMASILSVIGYRRKGA
ncbi:MULTISPECIES: heme lyase CcmF/NrfE family subunit [Glaesserella]|uniref:Heme lyase NrfEFG subunit NrfE n=1 Tax=Glaesserella australis TaxID=2094024 RepID=A0A328C2R1_9PAST|nr:MULTISPECIES: heme lyase CcmF/NrfE family subunit [Glaesserella]AUI66446.1 heme lyase NrfEFG subunit NrfE [Glaesserella sp. 15-184]RAL19340.1 heme lyase NrfEFG subunit NrfE [Glaesserella australis]